MEKPGGGNSNQSVRRLSGKDLHVPVRRISVTSYYKRNGACGRRRKISATCMKSSVSKSYSSGNKNHPLSYGFRGLFLMAVVSYYSRAIYPIEESNNDGTIFPSKPNADSIFGTLESFGLVSFNGSKITVEVFRYISCIFLLT